MTTINNNSLGKLCFKYYCEYCDYGTCKKSSFSNHTNSKKHKNNELTIKNNKLYANSCPKIYLCEYCDKHFNDRAGLWRHKKKCNEKCLIEKEKEKEEEEKEEKEKNKMNDKDIINLLLTQNKELMNLLKNGIINNTTNNNTTNNNKIFNLNFFLNETCKDAMNISEFVSSIKVNLEELENTGRQGYIEGISKIIVNRLNNLEQHFRPLHCSDSKREILYIKDNNEWIKESEDKPILTKAIKIIANENIKQIKTWRENNTDCTLADSKKNNLYLKIVSNSMNGLTKEEGDKNISKIISNVAKKTIIMKE